MKAVDRESYQMLFEQALPVCALVAPAHRGLNDLSEMQRTLLMSEKQPKYRKLSSYVTCIGQDLKE